MSNTSQLFTTGMNEYYQLYSVTSIVTVGYGDVHPISTTE